MFRVLLLFLFALATRSAELQWLHLSSTNGHLPLHSSEAKVHSGSLVGDFDGDKTNDFIIAFADAAPALVLYRGGTNWTTLPIELEQLAIGAGGAALDIDQDGDLDAIFGSEAGPDLWWWENPRPNFDARKPWVRRPIRSAGASMNRGQIVADLTGAGWPQVLFWNQGTNTLFHAPIPSEVRKQSNWVATPIFTAPTAPPGTLHTLASIDLNIDGLLDVVAGNYWLRRVDGFRFEPTRIGNVQGRSAIGRFRDSTYPQIVIAPQTERGRATWYECKSHPERSDSWAGRHLLGHDIAATATLAIADLNKDGNDDIFLTERKEPTQTSTEHSPNAWIFFSDGRGNFRATLFGSGLEIYEAKIFDVDADNDLDIVSTPHSAGAPRLDIWLNVTDFARPPIEPK
ncbi:MAG TPA: VCBS repeat-containing protein [Verrucomicrobiae bacterium]